MYLGEKGEWLYYRKGFKEYISNHEDREPHVQQEANKTFMPMLEQFEKVCVTENHQPHMNQKL